MDNTSEEDTGKTFTMDEYIGILEEQELEADLVLGGDEGKDCTDNKGYMKRQAVFSCLTCTPDGNAGVCCACSLSCHDGHQSFGPKENLDVIVEIQSSESSFASFCRTKILKIVIIPTIITSKVVTVHVAVPTPDPEAEEPEEMIQCCVCEDWFHEEHIGLDISDAIPRDGDGEPLYEDFICGTCSALCSVIRLYPKIILDPRRQDATVVAAKDKNVAKETSVFGSQYSAGTADSHSYAAVISAVAAAEHESDVGGTCLFVGESSEKNEIIKYTKDDGTAANCMLEDGSLVSLPASDGKPMFLAKNWRDVLCRCEKYQEFYSEKHIGFLLDKKDSIMEYEESAKLKREENLQKQEGAELNFLNKFGHVEKMEILHGINDMKDELRTFLESFDSSRAVTSADVQQIFENLEKKRRRVQSNMFFFKSMDMKSQHFQMFTTFN